MRYGGTSGTSLIIKRLPVGPYLRPLPRFLARGVPGGWALPYGRGTPVFGVWEEARSRQGDETCRSWRCRWMEAGDELQGYLTVEKHPLP